MLRLETVEWGDPRAVALRDAMNAETAAMYAEFTAQRTPEQVAAIDDALSVDPATIVHTIIALDDGVPLGHAALRPVSTSSTNGVVGSTNGVAGSTNGVAGSTSGVLEVKKVFVAPQARGRGVAKVMLAELESFAVARGVASLVLQTGPLQVEAIALYLKLGYLPIGKFGKYGAIPGALCYEKTL
ncbi:MAG: family N-acetyltransferase [Rhodoglobus sp.]|nr:family N-acetyltransferase [Rhodoglobus sp.]